MLLENPDLPDATKVQEMVTYDIVPEVETYLQDIVKTLHGSIDEIEESLKDDDKKDNYDDKDDEAEDEEKKEGEEDDDDDEDRGRSRKRDKGGKSSKKDTEATVAEKGDIAERIEAIYAANAKEEKALDEANQLKEKYRTGCRVYDGFI